MSAFWLPNVTPPVGILKPFDIAAPKFTLEVVPPNWKSPAVELVLEDDWLPNLNTDAK